MYIPQKRNNSFKISKLKIFFCFFKIVIIDDIGELRNDRKMRGSKIRTKTPVLFQFSPKISVKKKDKTNIIEKMINPNIKIFL